MRARLVLILSVLGYPYMSLAFSLLPDSPGTVRQVMEEAQRWSAEPDPFGTETGLHDRIQVAVDSNFVSAIGGAEVAAFYRISEDEVEALTRESIQRALAMWEHSGLRFEIEFGGPAELGPLRGAEIDLFAFSVPSTLFGYADVEGRLAESRLLTNGTRLPGSVIVGADVVLNTDRVRQGIGFLTNLSFPIETLAGALQILIAHEFGHAIGLGHPNLSRFYDTDSDPFNTMNINPFDPFAGLSVSSIPSSFPAALLPIMWGGLSSTNPSDLIALLERLNDPTLSPDDRGGRDVLYPVVEPPTPTPTTTPSPTATSTPRPCPGDCDHTGTVTIDELIRGISIALGDTAVDACPAMDTNGDGQIQVHEVVEAVTVALSGC